MGSPRVSLLLAALTAGAALAAAPRPAGAQRLLTQKEALELAFPQPARVERRTAFLTEAQLEQARRLAGSGVDVDQIVVTYYAASRDGSPLGVAYFDAHRVRTMTEVLMIVVSPEGTIQRIEVLEFSEPPEYRPSVPWLDQFRTRGLDEKLSLKGAIRGLTGASLTSQAVTRASRRVLALDRVIRSSAPADSGAGR